MGEGGKRGGTEYDGRGVEGERGCRRWVGSNNKNSHGSRRRTGLSRGREREIDLLIKEVLLFLILWPLSPHRGHPSKGGMKSWRESAKFLAGASL